jgi:hypothetical protein
VAAARFAEIGTRDPQPLELGRGGEHPLKQPPVGRLGLGPPIQPVPSLRHPGGKLVANPLQLAEADQTRLAAAGPNPRIDLDAGKRLRDEAAQLQLETTDLTPQLSAGETLVAPTANPEGVSVEQLRHDSFQV